MAERPILFSGEMVRAILDGRKTQTRRVMKPKANEKWLDWITDKNGNRLYDSNGDKRLLISSENGKEISCPYGAPGDLLWVRETWVEWDAGIAYRADTLDRNGVESADNKRCRLDYGVKWKPSIHMPRKASRITLRVTDVWVERVQEISEADARAEGTTPLPSAVSSPESKWLGLRYTPAFAMLWNDINAARGYGWDANPWVWVVSFEKVTP